MKHRRDPQPDEIRELALRGRNGKGLVGRPYQPASEGDALDFIAVKQRVRSAAEKRGLQLPGEIDGVADARIHALSAGGAMDVRRVAQQEGAAFAKVFRQCARRSWRVPAGGSPAQVRGSARLVASVARPSATAAAKRTQRSCGVGY